ncbi:MAG: chitobiase/beta-hexosaminidase C-terminal domain-containing protein [Saprospiraceae bacterium]|nr:chitobiase/beta-hexosaminidase C-terminal domain-containing protein [Saprospiraceae bacterium]
MKRTKTIITSTVFFIQILLFFLLLFEKQVQIPIWLQPVGRTHPLLLHLPIGLLILLALLPLLKREIPSESLHKFQSFTLYLATFTASLTALMGLFLAQEEGYDTTLVNWHKWSGVGVSFLTYSLLIWHNQVSYNKKAFNIAVIANVILLIIAGHLGVSITYGEDYILKPIRKEKLIVADNNIPVFVAAIQPILDKKCNNCHNESKAKGELIMTSLEQLMKGGKHGVLWLAGNVDSSLLLQRVKLPLEHDDHMPPKEKPQLTAEEIELIQSWIRAGADIKQTLADLQPSDTLFTLVHTILQRQQATSNKAQAYTFNAASDKKIKELNNPFRAVYPVALNSPALHAEIFVRQAYKSQYLQELTSVQAQLVSLNLTNMPIQDENLKTIAKFDNLEKLILNGTNITGANLSELQHLKKLQTLGLSNTSVDKVNVKVIKDFPALQNIYVWNTKITQEDIKILQKDLPNIQFDGGYVADETEVLQLSPPLLKNKSMVLAKDDKIILINKLSDITTRYTTDGTDPDSLTSLIYKEPLQITKYTTLKVKNFKANWKSSEVKIFTFFPKGQSITNVVLRTFPEPTYEHKGALTLYDNRKGEVNNFRSPLWLNFKDQPLDALFYFDEKQPPVVQEITLSIAKNIGGRAFPQARIEVWGGADTTNMQQLSIVSFKQPTTYETNEIIGLPVAIPKSSFPWYRIVARPFARTPNWHYEKQYNPRIAVDEVFFYE